MAKNYSKKIKTRKSLIAMLCAISVTCTGLAAACSPSDDEEPNGVTAREDTQLLKNGNFEHFDIPDKAVHLIKNVNSWSLGGDTSVKSGIIDVSKSGWADLTDPALAKKLDYNNDLAASDDEYVNYNSMRSRDILYKDTYAAKLSQEASDSDKDKWIIQQGYEEYFGIKEKDGKYYLREVKDENEVFKSVDDEKDKNYYFDKDCTKPVREELITNPGTHYVLNEDETKVTVDGKDYDVLKDKDTGSLYYKDGDGKENYISSVLMVHNSPTDTKFNGINQYYTSSTITLEANTSAEISFWVKTSDLKFDKGYSALGDEDKGAYVEVVQTVASATIDNFAIRAINTEKIIAGATGNALDGVMSNGWLKYTVYVNACDFASSTVQLKLGLGGTDINEKVTGYAFFDDVQVTKYRSLEDEDCTYTANASKTAGTSCNLTSDEEDKIFYADVQTRGDKEVRNAYDFHYLIDLASEKGAGNTYQSVTFGSNVQAGLTTEKDSKGKVYAASKSNAGTIYGVTGKTVASDINLVKDTNALPTDKDFIGTNYSQFTANSSYQTLIKNAVNKLGTLPASNNNYLAMFSAWGVPYTSTVNDASFTVGADGYKIVSLWVKTSDMDGNTAATLKIYEEKKVGDETLTVDESVQTLTIDTTGNKVNFENEKDIYDGWVQCFFFIKNDTEAEKTFKIDFSFGTTSIIDAKGDYNGGWAIIANMQTLEIDEDIYKLASSNSTCALFSFYDEDEDESGSVMDEANSAYDIEKGIAIPGSYTGKNGVNNYDAIDKHLFSGLINKEYANSYSDWNTIASSFTTAEANWKNVFGDNCYQPLIIINDGLRRYAEKADITEDAFNNGTYYVKVDDDETGDITIGGKKYKLATEWKDGETYYSIGDVLNYGYVGESKSLSANNTETITVRVKVVGEGAEAWIYLVDPETKEVLSYTTPDVTFYYDKEGNVLDKELDEDWKDDEHRKHIVYTLRDDGLYDSTDKGDKKVYANLHNLVKVYDATKYEHTDLYDEDGNKADPDNLEKNVDYYLDENRSKHADYYLATTDGTNVYECKDGKFYYLELNDKTEKVERTTEVTNFAEKYARYDTHLDEKFAIRVTAEECKTLGDNDGWVTVNFVVQTGSEAKDYRLELWNGSRDKTGADSATNSAVAFDVSKHTVNNFETRLSQYESEILIAYYKLVKELPNASELFDEIETESIAAYEKLLADHNIEDTVKKDYGYDAKYYTYTLYDSTNYVPFNANTAAEGETGYNYDSDLFTEKLAYFTFDDEQLHSKNVFVDYTTVDQDITLNTAPDDEDKDEDEDKTGTTELGLYISSIVLVVVLLITLVSIFVTQFIKNKRKQKGEKAKNKNVYRKRDRYIKKLHLVKNEEEVFEGGESAENVESVPETPAEMPAEEITEVTEEVTEVTEEAPEATDNTDGEDKQ